ncbi:chorismate-binding protein [Nocardioides sp.]|uniref:chorismate-binding protein n=1 Tax=Nocardioides sp. TaxID=35761 RepID=UPI0019BD43F5|nr:chorismate-binding protein [Nocardioides sp.]MBC7278420.1 chorismate-binding protein [Nocardioides sp.]
MTRPGERVAWSQLEGEQLRDTWLLHDQTSSTPTLLARGVRLRVSVFVGGFEVFDPEHLLTRDWWSLGERFRTQPWMLFDAVLEVPGIREVATQTPVLFHLAFEATHADDSIPYPPGVTEDTLLAELVLPEAVHEVSMDGGSRERPQAPPRTPVGLVTLPETGAEPADAYRAAFEAVTDHIAQGDAYQVVLSHSVRHQGSIGPRALFDELTSRSQVPYAFMWPLSDGRTLVGASPECFAKSDGVELHLHPLAGTVRRSGVEELDSATLALFKEDVKELGEHLMLLDLCRDDIANTCVDGSVEVRSEFEVEAYGNVFHLASHVAGRLDRSRGPFETLRRVFPAGTMTGAPRLRAMEIISALEPEARGAYAGVVGCAYSDGRFDSAICIRMVEVLPQGYRIRAAGGVLWDSSLVKEWEEVQTKLSGPRQAVRTCS